MQTADATAIFSLSFDKDANNVTTLTVGFGSPATGDQIVQAIAHQLSQQPATTGGKLLKVIEPISCAGAIALAHWAAHRFSAVAAFDPKLSKFIVTVSHDPQFGLGALID